MQRCKMTAVLNLHPIDLFQMETFRSFINAPWVTSSMTALKPPLIPSLQSLVDWPRVPK